MRLLAVALLALAVACTPANAPSASPSDPASTSPTVAATSRPPSPTTASPIGAVGHVVDARSDVPRSPREAATEAQLAAVVAADRAFAFDLYRTLVADESDNVFLSPYSISTAMSMVLAGARGQTAEELASALGVGADDAAWHLARNRLELELTALADFELPGDPDAVPLTLEPTNAIFGQVGFPFKQPYLDTLAANYGAGMYGLDFAAEPDASRAAVNQWVAERTRDRIPELIPVGVITPKTRAVLVNAIYFMASWLFQFDPDATETGTFHLLDGSTVDVAMMQGTEKRQYAAGDGWQAVELPYVGRASMLVIVPDEGGFATIEADLDERFLAALEGQLTEHVVDLALPRWESDSQLKLIPPLESLGIELLFSLGGADLTGIADAALFVSEVVHAANITVDEKGTEAAAATAVVVDESGAPPATLTVDRPFIYLIRDDANGEILFMGRLLQP
jgi:serpin B